MKDKINFKKIFIFLIVIICIIFLYYSANSTYTSYESIADTTMEGTVAGIKVAINGKDIVSSTDGVTLDSISWSSLHTREGKIAPGATGTITFTLDPTGSDVAFLYEFEFVDKQSDDSKLFTFTSFSASDDDLIQTDKSTYTGIISLDDISSESVVDVTVNFEFTDVDIDVSTEDTIELDDYFEIKFHALQYNGEEIVPYNEQVF